MEQPWESTRLFATPVVNPISISCLLGYKITEVIDIDLGEYPEYCPATNRDRQPLNLHNLVYRLHATYANHIQKRRTLAHLIDVSFLDLQYIHQDVVNGYTPPNETINPRNPDEDFEQMFYEKHAIVIRSKTGQRNLKAHSIRARKEDEYQIAVQKHRYLDLYYNSTPSPPNEGPPALHVPTRNARGQARKRRITHWSDWPAGVCWTELPHDPHDEKGINNNDNNNITQGDREQQAHSLFFSDNLKRPVSPTTDPCRGLICSSV